MQRSNCCLAALVLVVAVVSPNAALPHAWPTARGTDDAVGQQQLFAAHDRFLDYEQLKARLGVISPATQCLIFRVGAMQSLRGSNTYREVAFPVRASWIFGTGAGR